MDAPQRPTMLQHALVVLLLTGLLFIFCGGVIKILGAPAPVAKVVMPKPGVYDLIENGAKFTLRLEKDGSYRLEFPSTGFSQAWGDWELKGRTLMLWYDKLDGGGVVAGKKIGFARCRYIDLRLSKGGDHWEGEGWVDSTLPEKAVFVIYPAKIAKKK